MTGGTNWPWPTWLRLLTAAGALGACVAGVVIVRAVRRRRRAAAR